MRTLSRLLPFAFFAIFLLAALTPFLTFAQAINSNAGNLTGVTNFISNLVRFINSTLVPAIFALAFLVFLWGVFQTFILGGSDEDKQKEGKQLMLYAIAGFVIMVSIWGIVNLVANGFGFTGQSINPSIPTTPLPAPR